MKKTRDERLGFWLSVAAVAAMTIDHFTGTVQGSLAIAPLAMAGIGLGLGAAKSFFGGKAKKKQEKENKRAQTEAANLKQKMAEDQRRSRVRLGASLLGGVPSSFGGIQTNTQVDPAVIEEMMKERTYNFGGAIPETKGSTDAFLAGLFGGGQDLLAGMSGAPPQDPMGGGSPTEGGNSALSINDLLALIEDRPTRTSPQPAPSQGPGRHGRGGRPANYY